MMLTNERLTEIAKKRQALNEMLGQPALTESLMRELTDVALDLSIADIPHLLAHADTLAARVAELEAALQDIAALGELPYVSWDGCTADGRIEAANIAKRALDGGA